MPLPSLRFPLLLLHCSNRIFRERRQYLSSYSFVVTTTANRISPEAMSFVAEYAKSNRSLCKSCSKSIASKSLRVGLISKGPGGIDMPRWHHLDCFPTDSESIASVDDIKGLSALEKDDQDALVKLVELCGEPAKEVGGKEEEVKSPASNEISGKKIKETTGSSASTKVIAEYAKSSRSSCKKCSQTIASKELRLGLVTRDSRGFDMTKWHHLGCFPVESDPVESVEDFGGFSSLQNEDQDALKELILKCGKKTLVDNMEEGNDESGAVKGLTEETNKRKHSQVDGKEEEVKNPASDEISGKKIKETKDSSASSKVIAEYAKSGRSSCKKCSQTIAAKELRLGLVTRDSRGYDMTKWHHLGCFPVESDPMDSVEDIGGFSSLENDDQDALKELILKCGKKTLVDNMEEDNNESGAGKGITEETNKIKHSQVDGKEEDPALDEISGQKIKETKGSTASSKVIAEYAKSGRSSCKKCSQTIAAKELRLGLVTRNFQGYDMTKWHHVSCFPVESDPIDSVEDISGFSSLENGDRDALKELVQQCEKKTLMFISESTSHVIVEAEISFSASDVKDKYRDASLLPKWKAFETVIFLERDDGLKDSEKIAAFDFDGCLANTSVKITGADKWSLMYPFIPEKLQSLYSQGYKLVIFTNESNIDRWKNKRQAAVDSKIGRLNSFIKRVEVPIQVFIACGVGSSGGKDDLYRKPKAGMWQLMKMYFNSGIAIDMDKSFYVGDAAGRTGDHSDADIKFAQASGLKFYTPEEYFIA